MQSARSYLITLGLSPVEIETVFNLLYKPIITESEKEVIALKIALEICNYFNLNILDVNSHTRYNKYAECRFIIYYFLHEKNHCTMVQIGKLFNRHYSTIINGIQRTKELMFAYPEFKSNMQALSAIVNQIINESV